jgi:ABC-2 type transport system ATP-binding protein
LGIDQRERVLSVSGLQKTIGKRTIVHNITFDVYEGEVFGFLGPNGAGKTTTIRMIVGLVKPTAGKVEICGCDIQRNFQEACAYIGCIVENPELYKFLTGRENLRQFARMLRGVGEERIQEVAELVGLEKRIDDKVKTYSLGMRQRLGIAQALLSRPRLLVLDEPTNGLDPSGIRELREFIKRLAAEEGIGIFVSSHILSEIELMCDRVAILHEGNVLQVGAVSELLNGATRKVVIEVDDIPTAKELIQRFLLEHNLPQTGMYVDGGTIQCELQPEWRASLNHFLVGNGIQVASIRSFVPTLEDLFLEVTGGNTIG